MMDIDKAFEEFIEFPDGSDGQYITTVSAKLFAKYCVEKLQEENERLLFSNRYNADMYRQIDDERKRLQAEVERLQLQLAACGVVAMANTPDSAARQRDMHPDYMSASCQDVIRAVDREMALREERDQLKGRLKKLNSAATAVIDSRAALGLDSNRYSVDMNLLIELSHCRPAQQAKEVQS